MTIQHTYAPPQGNYPGLREKLADAARGSSSTPSIGGQLSLLEEQISRMRGLTSHLSALAHQIDGRHHGESSDDDKVAPPSEGWASRLPIINDDLRSQINLMESLLQRIEDAR